MSNCRLLLLSVWFGKNANYFYFFCVSVTEASILISSLQSAQMLSNALLLSKIMFSFIAHF